MIQNALNRLKSNTVNAIYSAEHGVWQFADPAFEKFVQSTDKASGIHKANNSGS
jgi:hypothetical protein